MKSFRSNCELVIVATLAGLFYLVEAEGNVNTFRRCYNLSVDTHCFDMQYDTPNTGWLRTSFDSARKRCLALNSTLLIIKSEETNQIVKGYLFDSDNPIGQQFVWTDAYRVNEYDTYMWHWLDSTLPTIKASDVRYTYDNKYYVAVLEFSVNSYYLTAKGPDDINNYICEFPAVSNYCSTIGRNNARRIDNGCYVANIARVNWFEARSRCLEDGGDLASFVNITSINFTSWLVSINSDAFWIGLRFAWYTWIDTEEKVKYAKWIANDNDRYGPTPCLVVWNNYDSNPNFSWFPKEDTADQVFVVCHTVTSVNPPTTSTTTSTTTTTITTTSTPTSSTDPQIATEEPRKGKASNKLAIGVGVGVGVGVPILIALTVLVTCIVVRKRRNKTPSSTQSTNHQQKETSVDQPSHENPTDDEKSEAGVPTYGTVVLSTAARHAAEENKDNPTSGNAEYAPLQFL